jgi:hypothetical protein
MFLCEKCHKDCGCFTMSGSYGPCEGCRKVANCVDCHAHHTVKTEPKVKEKE